MVGVLNMMNTFSRLSVCSIVNSRNVFTYIHPLYFQATETLFGEPMKKKKKVDIAIIRAREERRKRKLSKQIRRLEKTAKQLKPIMENEILQDLITQKEKRFRHLTPLSEQEIERRALLTKEWQRYKRKEWLNNINIMESIIMSQENALKELKLASEELYERALEFDDSFVPYSAIGPVHTPPIKNYDSPDGLYTDITFVFEGEQ